MCPLTVFFVELQDKVRDIFVNSIPTAIPDYVVWVINDFLAVLQGTDERLWR